MLLGLVKKQTVHKSQVIKNYVVYAPMCFKSS
jgi:hypothetical protein